MVIQAESVKECGIAMTPGQAVIVAARLRIHRWSLLYLWVDTQWRFVCSGIKHSSEHFLLGALYSYVWSKHVWESHIIQVPLFPNQKQKENEAMMTICSVDYTNKLFMQ
jgi:hypothetical protein